MRKTSLLKTIAFALLAGAFLFGAAPIRAQVAVDLPDVTARVGTSATIPITVGDLTGEGVISYEFTISFDESVVELTGVTVDGTLSEGVTPTVNTGTAGELSVSFATTTALSGSGTLLRLDASYVAEGASALTFDNFLFNEGDPAAVTDDGSVDVVVRAVFIGDDLTGFAGQSDVLIPVEVNDLTADDDVLAFQFDVNFDPAVLEFTGATTDGSISAGFQVVTNEIADGVFRVAAAGTEPIVGEGTLVFLRANLLAGGTSNLTLSNIVFNEGTPVIAGIAGQIVVGAAEAFAATLAAYNEVNPTEATLLNLDFTPTGAVNASLNDGQLVLTGTFSGLSAAYTASHIHLGGPGVSAGVVIPLSPTVDSDGLGGTFEAANNTFMPVDTLLAALREGRLYVNVHTSRLPAGEIRGQLLDAPNAAPEAVAISSPADGTNITVTGEPDQIVRLEWPESTDPNGDEVVYVVHVSANADFSDFNNTRTLTEPFDEIRFEGLENLFTRLGVGLDEEVTIFYRVSSQDGSLRAIGPSIAINYTRGFVPNADGNLAGMNEAPPVQSTGSGSVFASITSSEVVISGSFRALSAPFTASHIHAALPGVDGPVIIPLTVDLDADSRGGMFRPEANTYRLGDLTYPAGFTAASVAAALMNEETYVNVHSTAYPAGELRAQLKTRGSEAPPATTISFPPSGGNFNVGTNLNDRLFTATWTNPAPSENLAFIYQVATSASFANVILSKLVVQNSVEVSVREAREILEEHAGTDAGASVTVFHRVIASDGSLWTAGASSSFTLTRTTPGENVATEPTAQLPKEFALRGNYPNPFNPSTSISFDLPETADVRIVIVDLLGREVLVLPSQTFAAGANRTVEVDASRLSSGTYLYRVIARGAGKTVEKSGTMTLMK